MNEIKFSVFADLHHWPGYFCTDGFKSLDIIRDHATRNDVDFVMQLGDLCHAPSNFPEIIECYEKFPMPTYHCIGNHEFEGNTLEQTLTAYHMDKPYYYFDRNGFRFIVLDLNCMRIEGKCVHYSNGNFFRAPKNKQLVTFDEEQFSWLENTIMSSPYLCVLLSHHSLERQYNGMSEEENGKVREMLCRVNDDRQRVLLAINGHHHRDHLTVRDNIAFFDLNSTSSEWVEPPHTDKFPKELYDNYKYAGNSVFWEDPIHAVITLRDDGYIKIEGMKSQFAYGIDHKALGKESTDSDGRKCTAEVLSAELKIDLK